MLLLAGQFYGYLGRCAVNTSTKPSANEKGRYTKYCINLNELTSTKINGLDVLHADLGQVLASHIPDSNVNLLSVLYLKKGSSAYSNWTTSYVRSPST